MLAPYQVLAPKSTRPDKEAEKNGPPSGKKRLVRELNSAGIVGINA